MGTGESRPGSEAWRSVDGSGVADDMVAYLDRAAAATLDLRAESFELLRIEPGATVLEAGCGTGIAALELAELVGPKGSVDAIDASEAMVACTAERARSAAVIASIGDIRAIDLADHSCDAARVEGADPI